MKKIILGLLISINAFAGYECEVKLAHSEDLYQTIAESKISATSRDLRTIHLKEFFTEEKSNNKSVGLSIQAAIVGWSGEEEVTLAVFRRTAKKNSIDSVSISDKLNVKGSDSGTLWFDNYKLELKCQLQS